MGTARRPAATTRKLQTPVLEALAPHRGGRDSERSPLSFLIGIALLGVLVLGAAGGAVLARRRRGPERGGRGESTMDELEAELQEIIAEERARRRESLER